MVILYDEVLPPKNGLVFVQTYDDLKEYHMSGRTLAVLDPREQDEIGNPPVNIGELKKGLSIATRILSRMTIRAMYEEKSATGGSTDSDDESFIEQ